ncbi:MAG: hypothetical protein AB7F50_10875 [Fimbriimonadaceae bacterium]
MRYWIAAVAMAAAGCGGGDRSWWPLRAESSHSYSLERGATTLVADWKVVGTAPVGSSSGYVVASPVGDSVLAWQGERLVASQLGGTRFVPPIPVLVQGEAKWRGTVVSAGRSVAGSAVVKGARAKERHPVFGVRTLEVLTNLRLPGSVQVVESVFADQVGLVSQSQRTNDILDYRLTLLGSD